MVAEVPKKNAGGGMPLGRWRHGWYGLLSPTVLSPKSQRGRPCGSVTPPGLRVRTGRFQKLRS
jgi:hypothetical protein